MQIAIDIILRKAHFSKNDILYFYDVRLIISFFLLRTLVHRPKHLIYINYPKTFGRVFSEIIGFEKIMKSIKTV